MTAQELANILAEEIRKQLQESKAPSPLLLMELRIAEGSIWSVLEPAQLPDPGAEGWEDWRSIVFDLKARLDVCSGGGREIDLKGIVYRSVKSYAKECGWPESVTKGRLSAIAGAVMELGGQPKIEDVFNIVASVLLGKDVRIGGDEWAQAWETYCAEHGGEDYSVAMTMFAVRAPAVECGCAPDTVRVLFPFDPQATCAIDDMASRIIGEAVKLAGPRLAMGSN